MDSKVKEFLRSERVLQMRRQFSGIEVAQGRRWHMSPELLVVGDDELGQFRGFSSHWISSVSVLLPKHPSARGSNVQGRVEIRGDGDERRKFGRCGVTRVHNKNGKYDAPAFA